MTTREERDELRKLSDEAYPGPWAHWPEAGWIEVTADNHATVIAGQVRPRLGFEGEIYVDNDEPTAAFIATARTAVPALLDDVDRLTERLDAVRAIHTPDPDSFPCPEGCCGFCEACGMPTPCPTIRAFLGGGEPS